MSLRGPISPIYAPMMRSLPLSRSFTASIRPTASPLAGPSRSTRIVNARRSYSTPADTASPPTGLDEGERKIHAKLAARFGGKQLEVQDVSGGCGSFYAIVISSPEFNGLTTIKQHKLVNECLKEDIQGIHGLQLKTIPEQD